jgi:hypothetical protein
MSIRSFEEFGALGPTRVDRSQEILIAAGRILVGRVNPSHRPAEGVIAGFPLFRRQRDEPAVFVEGTARRELRDWALLVAQGLSIRHRFGLRFRSIHWGTSRVKWTAIPGPSKLRDRPRTILPEPAGMGEIGGPI